MILKKLEISGFKSFGKPVTLEFDAPITAVVGPNGSGKSNVSEAVRWVLGEQSLKSLRGKRGEDLIFHGGGGSSPLGKARVRITFDNASQIFPVDFKDVIISREVFRDGVNEYRVNDSPVRLKDIIELMSSVGVGGSGHHIISQGEADRVLYASPRERKRMIEDALGLRIYHIKRAEAERKLAATKENMREIEMLYREIQPHMRFLKDQAAKMEASQKLHEKLVEAVRMYIFREAATIRRMAAELEEKERPIKEDYERAAGEAEHVRLALVEKQSAISSADPPAIAEAARRLAVLEQERRVLERDAGRLEGQLAVLKRRNVPAPETVVFSAAELERELHAVLALLDEAADMEEVIRIRGHLGAMRRTIADLLTRAARKEKEADADEDHAALLRERDDVLHRLGLGEEEKKELTEKKTAWEEKKKEFHRQFFEDQKALRAADERVYAAKDALRSCDFAREQLRARTEEFTIDKAEAEPLLGPDMPPEDTADAKPWNDNERIKEKRSLQHLRAVLEEAGGINPDVLREYEEVQTRSAFLRRELEDLEKTADSLRALMAELEENLAKEFSGGVTKINAEFTKLFESMFGGGSAKLVLLRLQSQSEEDTEKKTEEFGIEVAVDIPRKRVKNLDMLSGGERALTSIALLFAMSFVNPPPFLVLDETDAALDEANSQRYGAMLRNLGGKTQLIVITHNRQTMKEASVLYGVTMGSDGVSRLLSLKFEEAAEVSGKPHEIL